MSVSMVSSSFTSQTTQRPQGPGKEIRQGIDSLKQAVESGDLTAAQTAYDSLSKLQADKKGSSTASSTSSTSDGKDPLSKLLSSVGDALKTGDISSVQQAFAQNGPPSGGPGGAGGGPGGGGPGGGAGGPPPGGPPPDGGSSDVRDAVGSLAQSLQSGDTTSAQDSLASLTKLLTAQSEDDDDEEDESSSSSTSSSKSTSSTSNSFLDKLKSSLSDIGSALESGDTATAQKLFSSLSPRGSGVNVVA